MLVGLRLLQLPDVQLLLLPLPLRMMGALE
jgi:hypothetical protein